MKSLSLARQMSIVVGALTFAALCLILLAEGGAGSPFGALVLAGILAQAVGLSAGLFVRRALQTLDLLTDAAERMGSGDLTTLIQVEARSAKIARLAQTLETTRTALAQQVEELTTRRNAQTYFLASMSHEFRTPLAGMQASLELLQENFRVLSPDDSRQLLNSIQLSLSMLHQLIDNLLESSKLEANHFTLNRRASEVEVLLGEAIRLIEPMIVRRQQALTLEVPLEVPMLQVDPTRSIQMIVNLLSNASKYSPVGSVIEIGVAHEVKTLRISIADRGRGITPEKQNSLFLPFVRLEPESQTDHGSGLGLAVVKAIAEAHQGHVGVEARAGGGSIFWFTLPLTETKS
ncbi:MAG: ATP-binding protein [Chloroflexota bacterium]